MAIAIDARPSGEFPTGRDPRDIFSNDGPFDTQSSTATITSDAFTTA